MEERMSPSSPCQPKRDLVMFYAIMKPLLLSLLVLLFSISSASCLISNINLSRDHRALILLCSYSYNAGGILSLDMDNYELYIPSKSIIAKREQADQAGFILIHSASEATIHKDFNTNQIDAAGCFHSLLQKEASNYFIAPQAQLAAGRNSIKVSIKEPGFYHLYWSNCEANSAVTGQFRVTQYNLDPWHPSQKNYLNAGESPLPMLYSAVFALFVVQLISWCIVLKHAGRDSVKLIHYLMLVVLIVKALSILFQALKYTELKHNGLHNTWFYLYDILAVAKGILMFITIILIGTGYSYIKPFLADRDKKMILVVLLVQAALNSCMIIMDETGVDSISYISWKNAFHMLDFICCVLVVLPILWNIEGLRTAAKAEKTRENSRNTRNMQRLKSFRAFYLLVLSYAYVSRILVALLINFLPFDYAWISAATNEGASLLFYAITGLLFRPESERIQYWLVNTEDLTQENELDNLEIDKIQAKSLNNLTPLQPEDLKQAPKVIQTL
jgi:hypothetical protein